MTLVPELQAAVDSAQAGDLRGMHQILLGPGPSGKTTQAHEYAAALAAKGLGGKLSLIDPGMIRFVGMAGKLFSDAKGGTIIIDELQNTSDTLRREIFTHITRAISDNDTLVIITGAISLENDIAMDPGLQRRMNKPVMMDRQFTREEMDAFNAERRADRAALNEEEQRRLQRAQRVAEWKTAKAEDLQPKKPYGAPQTARFRKPEVSQ